MSLSLPDAITTYFSISNGANDTHLGDCFTQDACVLDEGETHCGRTAIQAWLRATRANIEYSVEPISVSQQGNTMVVTATVTGNFPGSPVQLDHTFQLADMQIQSLEIH
ncbi:nuclear transport factor 2 family protein [Vreelandella neptunia]|uniref:Nuclear transport factor 2 family protein n=1 Tax=Vreelandella neptunia TaxID=115551 RepID=A0ABZ0YHN2_9GAMM|nr:nuclear transport factor 2 family protein [Halomonas neptunia]MDN3561063.1 nuclear transport factor 2 family protein [Halomonas neptunia]TDW00334.1 SnoaL-like protein [Halomonas alkaliantarctica]WQH11199.1 nuclear transport factor 2 family protein [Halomonas neptunia]